MRYRLCPAGTLVIALGICAASFAQHPSEFTARDKTELFIQHIVKVMRVEPAKYQSLVLEYEIGTALQEISVLDSGDLGGNFIRRALLDLHPELRETVEAVEKAGYAEIPPKTEARLRALTRNSDPYVSALAGLLEAEVDFRAGKYDAVVERCEGLILRHRIHLLDDYRACELVALSFEKKKKALLEFAQYVILLVDYQDIPKPVEARVKARLAALDSVSGRPLHTVASWMNEVEKYLSNEVTSDEPTQAKEQQIVVALDKLIELQEAKERNTCSSCGGNCKGACRNGPPKGSRSKSHARFSALPPPGEGEMRLHGVSRADAETIWGQLREKEASRALQGFRGKLPPHYEKLLEQYYEDLSRKR